MKRFFCSLVSSLKRSVLSRSFLGAALGLAAASLISVYQEAVILQGLEVSVVYMYEVAIYANFWILYLLFAAIPGATLFCADWENRYIRFLVSRSGKLRYSLSTAVSCWFSSFAVVFAGEWLFLGALCLRYPLYLEQDVINMGLDASFYSHLIKPETILLFYLIRFLIKAFSAGFYSVFALWLSTKITNLFVTLASPIIFHYLLENLMTAFGAPGILRFSNIAKGLISPDGSLKWAVCYPAILFTALAAVFGLLFYKNVKRRLENG